VHVTVKDLFKIQTIGRGLLISFLVAQVIVWLLEIRASGFREWVHTSLQHSYFHYLSSRSRFERIRLIVLGFTAFAVFIVVSTLI
jgi:hypothetical protein